MTDLSCSVISCKYNNSTERLCALKNITVDGHRAVVSSSTECKSFREKDMDMTNSEKCDCDNAKLRTDIECFADKCVYNCGYNCTADHIKVAGGRANSCSDTCCDTFCLD